MSYWNGSEWVPEQQSPAAHASRRRRFFGATLEASLIVLLMFGLIASTALAAKGGNGGGKGGGHGGGSRGMTGALTLLLVSPPDANYGEGVRFDVVTNAPWPFVDLDCSQNGAVVYHSTVGYYGGWPWGDTFTLGGWMWPSGSADCVATLYNSYDGSRTVLSTLSFHVEP